MLFILWLSSTFLLYFVYSCAPNVENGERIRFPRDLEDLRRLAQIMSRFRWVFCLNCWCELFRDEKFYYTLLLFTLAFLYKQAFAIPGSFFMVSNGITEFVNGSVQNLLAGALFGSLVGIPLVCILTAIGASCCFLLSYLFAHSLVDRFFHNRLHTVRAKVGVKKSINLRV